MKSLRRWAGALVRRENPAISHWCSPPRRATAWIVASIAWHTRADQAFGWRSLWVGAETGAYGRRQSRRGLTDISTWLQQAGPRYWRPNAPPKTRAAATSDGSPRTAKMQ